MCGIAGFRIPGCDGRAPVSRMLEAMRMRGPDYQALYSFGDTSIGHCRLKIIDLSEQANQPFANENGTQWLIANGEVYNYRELRGQLEGRGHRFRSFSDSEVILHGYEEWGVGSFSRLRGMYAFCLFDQNEDRLILARDRLGIKPLYYYYRNGNFVFASQVKAILASGIVPRSLSAQALSTYLDYGGVSEPLTMIEGVVSLLPGHYAVLDKGILGIHKYWDLADSIDRGFRGSRQDAVEETRSLLEESVRLHLVSDVPLGLFLSGGIDSSSLLSIIAGLQPAKIKTVSLVFKEPGLDERRFSRFLAEKYQTYHHQIEIDEKNIVDNLSAAIEAMDQPTFDGINSYFVSRAARQAGLTVVVSGLGGDEVFCGYPSFKAVPELARLSAIIGVAPHLSRKLLAGFFAKISGPRPGKDKIIEFIRTAGEGLHPYFWVRRLFTDEQERDLLGEYRRLPHLFPERLLGADSCNQVSYLELTHYMRNILLRDTDFMSMACSLEARVPFLDHVLVERVLSYPGRIKLGGPVNKPLLLSALREPLAEEITKRKKMGFVFPFQIWLKGALRSKVEEELFDMPKALGEFISPRGVKSIWEGFLEGRVSWQRPWALYVASNWVKLNKL